MVFPFVPLLLTIATCKNGGSGFWYDTDDRPKECVVFTGIPQAFVLDPLLCKKINNGVLNRPLPTTVVVCYADNTALVMVAEHLEDADLYSWEAISAIRATEYFQIAFSLGGTHHHAVGYPSFGSRAAYLI